jgi:hypothetical protein
MTCIGRPAVFDVYRLAVCRHCGAPWHRGMDNEIRCLME